MVAPVSLPGFPEGIATRGNRFYVSGPAAFGLPLGSAFVHAYDIRTGALEATYPITITNPFVGISAASCMAFGPDGKLCVIEPFVGVIRMNLDPGNTSRSTQGLRDHSCQMTARGVLSLGRGNDLAPPIVGVPAIRRPARTTTSWRHISLDGGRAYRRRRGAGVSGFCSFRPLPGYGCVAIQWRAMSRRRVIQMPSCFSM